MAVEHLFEAHNTCWIFVALSNEPRHLDHITYCVRILLDRSVSPASIFIFSDFPQDAESETMDDDVRPKVRHPSSLKETLDLTSFEYAFVVCGGHGTIRGLQVDEESETFISPHALRKAVASIRGLKVAALCFCQCYAGVFKHLDSHEAARAEGAPMFVSFGATVFYPSLSARAGGLGWSANLFQVNFFKWIANPVDIDGDGVANLIDGYKYAGADTIKELQWVWADVFADLPSHVAALEAAKISGGDEAELTALQATIDEAHSMLYNIQEPWLSNPPLAAAIRISLQSPSDANRSMIG